MGPQGRSEITTTLCKPGPECLNSIDLRWDLDIPIFTSPLGVSRVEDHKGRLILSFCIGGNEAQEEEATYPG